VNSFRYVVISPVRDEAEHLERTIQSMLHQTVRPSQWVLVNDGSTDGTPDIVNRWSHKESWITPVHRANRGQREAGGGVVEAFYEGYQHLSPDDWDFIVKLDGDVSFPKDYFERCLAAFADDPRLGIGGGVICHRVDNRLEVESNPRFHVRGACKIYRRACWEGIGGLYQVPGWDTVDEVKANMLGWDTRTFPELKVTHYRFTGAAAGPWSNAVKNGLGSYIVGYHPLFMLARCLNRAFEKPYFLASAGQLYGYLKGYIRRVNRIPDEPLIRYLRTQQLKRLSFGATIWK